MQTFKAKVKVAADRTLVIQLPEELQEGEYDVVLTSNGRSTSQVRQESGSEKDEQAAQKMNEAFDRWVEEVETMPLSPQPVQSEYHQRLIDKYRAQGLDL